MTFRKDGNRHERWSALTRGHAPLLEDLPPPALLRESAFRDYLTSGVHRGIRFTPSVFDLSAEALAKLSTFIDRAQFDMDVIGFDDYNEAVAARTQTASKRDET